MVVNIVLFFSIMINAAALLFAKSYSPMAMALHLLAYTVGIYFFSIKAAHKWHL